MELTRVVIEAAGSKGRRHMALLILSTMFYISRTGDHVV